MVRSFTPESLAPEIVDRLVDAARRGPSAGFTQALDWVVLEGPTATASYWDVALPPPRRADFPWPRLLDAPVLIIPVVRADDYVERYRESDKVGTGLGGSSDDWTVPYWHVDAGAAVMLLLLAAADEGLGALLFGQFEHESALARRFGLPSDRQAVGTIAVGHIGPEERPSRSVSRGRRSLDEVVHRGHW
jgi:nitroreductase